MIKLHQNQRQITRFLPKKISYLSLLKETKKKKKKKERRIKMSHLRPECKADRESKRQKISHSSSTMDLNLNPPLMYSTVPPPMFSFFQKCMQSANPPEAFYTEGVVRDITNKCFRF